MKLIYGRIRITETKSEINENTHHELCVPHSIVTRVCHTYSVDNVVHVSHRETFDVELWICTFRNIYRPDSSKEKGKPR